MTNPDWKEEPYVKEWLSKVSERTQKNYKERFPKWLAFIGMAPTQQIQKRFEDLQSMNPKERGFFEDKVVKEWIPDNQQMKQIYQHGDARDRALLLCLYQSGFSETDVSALNIQDLPNIQQCEGHYPITMHREKTGVSN